MKDMGMDIQPLLNMDINKLMGMVGMAMNTKSNTSIIMGMLPTTGNHFIIIQGVLFAFKPKDNNLLKYLI